MFCHAGNPCVCVCGLASLWRSSSSLRVIECRVLPRDSGWEVSLAIASSSLSVFCLGASRFCHG